MQIITPRASTTILSALLVAIAFVTTFEIVLFESTAHVQIPALSNAGSQSLSPPRSTQAFANVSRVRRVCGGSPRLARAVPPTLHDATIKLSPCVDRPWIGPRNYPKPPYRVLITNFGWNHPDQKQGLNWTRTIRSRELLQAVVDHPYFDPVDWDELNNRILRDGIPTEFADTRHYVFLDLETCYESDYPKYGRHETNLDPEGGRVANNSQINFDCYWLKPCPPIRRVLNSPLFRMSKLARLVFVECNDSGPYEDREDFNSTQFSLVSISARTTQHDLTVDQGLPPPLVANISLNREEVRDIESCRAESNRPYFFSFVGWVENRARSDLVRLHDPSRGVILLPVQDFEDQFASKKFPVAFTDLLKRSVFSAAPRGDNLFSYRFAEVLAAGAIPVVHSDGWVLPFRSELVNWTECLLHLPQSTVNDTVRILRSIASEQRCRMRRRCREIYETYMASPEGTIQGILHGLELLSRGNKSLFFLRDLPVKSLTVEGALETHADRMIFRLWAAYLRNLQDRPLLTKASAAAVIFFTSDAATQYRSHPRRASLTRPGEQESIPTAVSQRNSSSFHGSVRDCSNEEPWDFGPHGSGSRDVLTTDFELPRALSASVFGVAAATWLHYWWNTLDAKVERWLPSTTAAAAASFGNRRLANALVKVTIDQAVAAPAYTYAYYVITNAVGPAVAAAAATTTTRIHARGPDEKVKEGGGGTGHAESGASAHLSHVLHGAHDKAWAKLGPTMTQHYKVWPVVHAVNFYYVPLQHRVLVQNGVLVFWSAYLSHLNHHHQDSDGGG